MGELIQCFKCKGSGQIEKPIESGIKSGTCKACNVVVMGEVCIKRMEEHKGYCIECAGVPTGLDRLTRYDEICSMCGKKAWQH